VAADVLMSDALALDGSVLIVGASLGGLRTAQGLRDLGFVGTITLVGDEAHPPYDRPPLSKQVAIGKWDIGRTVLLDDERQAVLNLDLQLGRKATHLDPETATVTFADGGTLSADRVVIATGARPRTLSVPEGVTAHVVRSYEDGVALHQALNTEPKRVVVIGAGFIGAEVASSARSFGHEVTVVETQAIPLATILGEELGARCAALHEKGGVTLLAGTSVDGIAADGNGGAILTLGNGHELHADVLVAGIGVIPNTEWLVGSGLSINNGVEVDGALFAHDRVVAVGDVARFAWTRLNMTSAERIEHWQVAADHGRFAAEGLLAGRQAATPIQLLPYFWSDQYGVKLQMLGRPASTDHVHVVDEDDEGRLLALYERDGRVSAAFAISKPRALMQLRAALLEGVTVAEARQLLAN